MKQTLVLLLLLALSGAPLSARRQNTTRTGLQPGRTESTAPRDSTIVAVPSANLVVAGYDKPLRSRYETFFVTNNDTCEVRGLAITFTYYTPGGRMLHRASHSPIQTIPAGQTRQVKVRSWDVQQNFYYHLSPVPRRDGAAPFTVTMKIDSVWVRKM